MEPLIPITGYANTYEELCTKIAEPGEYYNVLEQKPFMTYHKLEAVEVGDTGKTTDVLGWYKSKAELESNQRMSEGEVWIVGEYAPYTRWKAAYVNYVLTWVEDGTEDIKILKNYKSMMMFGRAHLEPEEGIYYSVGGKAPFSLFGVVSSWEPVGTYISYVVNRMAQLENSFQISKKNVGEIAYMNGLYLMYTGETWERLDIPEPINNVYEHSFVNDKGEKYKLREGRYPGTLEYFMPKE